MLDIVSYFVNFTKDFQSDKERVSFLDCGYSANNIFVKSCSTAANASKRNPYFDIHKEYSVQFVINTMSQRNLYRLALSDFKNDFGGMVTQATLVRFLGGRNSMKWMGPIVNRNLSHYQLGSKSNLVFAKESDSLLSAFSKLAEHQIGGIPIINEELVLVGALSASDFKLCCTSKTIALPHTDN
jgi:CBS domain-containing protein